MSMMIIAKSKELYMTIHRSYSQCAIQHLYPCQSFYTMLRLGLVKETILKP